MMHIRTSRGAALLIFLSALVVVVGLVYYLHHTGKLDLTFLRKWGIEAGNVVKQASNEPDPKLDKIISVDIDDLSGALNESQIVERHRGAKLSCFSVRDPLGDYNCTTPVALFNDIPARSVSFFFRRDKLTSLRVTFPIDQHPELTTRLTNQYGVMKKIGLSDPATGRALQGWNVRNGLLGINDAVPGEREAVMLWATSSAVVSPQR